MSNVSVPQPPLWKEALGAIRANFAPGVVLWGIAAAIVFLYYSVPGTRPAFEVVAQWKSSGGFFYSIVATALFAGVIPFVFLWLQKKTRSYSTWQTLAFMTVLWSYRGLEIDLFYRLQSFLFGAEPTFGTVAAKVACDLFVYNVFWAAHFQLLAYHWKNSGFRRDAFLNYPWKGYFGRRFPVALVSTWTVWLPVVALTYSLPVNLQIPLFNLAACFWALVVTTLMGTGGQGEASQGPGKSLTPQGMASPTS